MKIRWTPSAAYDLEQISNHIAEDNPESALQTVRAIFSRIEELALFHVVAAKVWRRAPANWFYLLSPISRFIVSQSRL